MALREYTTAIGDLNVLFDERSGKAIYQMKSPGGCSRAYTAATLALLPDKQAVDVWSDCISYPATCRKNGGVGVQVQAKWDEAKPYLASMETALFMLQ
jgi:hypothetical protein